ncbi:MAG: purine phosphorylase [Gammaproteobacteria bacterium]|nr:purine phosphorylase [Gammaproteobacteria bacterium]
MDPERQPLPGVVSASRMEARTLECAGRRFRPLVNLPTRICGIGSERAARAAQELLAQGCGALVSWGFAGALVPRLRRGDLLVPARVVDADGSGIEVDVHWHRRMQQALAPAPTLCTQTLLQASAAVLTAEAKAALFASSRAAAVDMESATLGAVANAAGVPFLAVRAIVDIHSDSLPVWVAHALDDSGRLAARVVLTGLLRRPGDLSKLLRLARGVAAARASLARAARLAGPRLLAGHDASAPS